RLDCHSRLRIPDLQRGIGRLDFFEDDELSMIIALGAALAIGEVFTALLITFFVLFAEVLEEMNMDRGRRAMRDLLDFLPLTADVRRPEGVRQAPIAQIRPGDLVVVRPGGRIPVDGA